MTFFGMTVITAVATVILAVFAIVTAVLAYLAWRKQSKEVSDQAAMLRIQSEQLAEQRKINDKQTGILDLQGKELGEALKQREREAERQHRAQATAVCAWFARTTDRMRSIAVWGALARNDSELPVFDVQAFFHQVKEPGPVGAWEAVFRGSTTKPVRVLPPHTDQFVGLPPGIVGASEPVDDSLYVVSIEFTDAAGNRWERDPRGALNPRS